MTIDYFWRYLPCEHQWVALSAVMCFASLFTFSIGGWTVVVICGMVIFISQYVAFLHVVSGGAYSATVVDIRTGSGQVTNYVTIFHLSGKSGEFHRYRSGLPYFRRLLHMRWKIRTIFEDDRVPETVRRYL